ncbi:probable UDP-3-o-[3-hydroxymyristoyl] n-acetylglucosamine deacetylase 5 [Phtheirospermum japonicum]|uniref:UDP-3-O-acyl-N-acetylglucosamine deacetylase n=1 Tax=Phtheirospermum japonicum TaxID=374723 RepID=A0A830BI70_9LAMI|nr:probable UDP-3-o-[3-hydroxymyristoyl] n-acetylglucosamine deacetylase 5 [Phtheirospermum japonicum]
MIDLRVITVIAVCKSQYMLFKGWHPLFHDSIGRESPFLETICIPFASFAILWGVGRWLLWGHCWDTWCRTGKLQQTVANCIERTGRGLHSGDVFTVKLLPAAARFGRCFVFRSTFIRASIDYAVRETPLCTTLSRDGYRVLTVEHLLSALEACGIDNCRIEIEGSRDCDVSAEVPIFDGSAREWVEAINQAGLKVAVDSCGESCEKLAPYLSEPVHVMKNDSFIAAFPYPKVNITYGIDYPQAPTIGRQWFSSTLLDESFYSKAIASARTFCLYEEVEHMRNLGLIKGGSAETAIICSMSKGWLNPPLRYDDEPCRHKVLDLIGDMSLLAQGGNQGLLVAHIVAFKVCTFALFTLFYLSILKIITVKLYRM